MNTMFVSFSNSGSANIWFTISFVLRFAVYFCFPVIQNRQFILQPTCEETHNVARSPSGMYTASTKWLLSTRYRYLTVPSTERAASAGAV